VRAANIRNLKYKDKLAAQRLRRLKLKIFFIAAAAAALLFCVVYLLFFTPWLKINAIALEDLSSEHQYELSEVIEGHINRKIAGIPIGGNIFFFDPDEISSEMMDRFTFLKGVSIEKDYPHGIKIRAQEREAEGIWCVQEKCRYFDSEGVAWGEVPPSSGFLLLNIHDQRNAGKTPAVDKRYLKAIQTVIPALSNLDFKTKDAVIPAGNSMEFNIVVSDLKSGATYPLQFSLDSDIPGQIKVLQIFKNQKIDKSDFLPRYVDLRFDGRVYYK